MKVTPKAYVSIVALGVILFFLMYGYVKADTIIYQQPLHGTSMTTNNSVIWKIGTGLSGYASMAQTRSGANMDNASSSLGVYCFTDSTYAVHCDGDSGYEFAQFSVDADTGDNEMNWTFNADYELQPSYYYAVQYTVTNTGGANARIYGTTSPSNCYSGCNVSSGTPYLYLWSIEASPSQVGTTSRILSLIQPSNGATSPTSDVIFQFSWFNSGIEAYDIAQTEVSDLTQGVQITPQESVAALTGYGTTTHIYSLEPNHLHIWRACLVNSTTNQKTCSASRSLNVVGASASTSYPILPDVDSSNATSTASGGIFQFLNIPYLLQTRYPFSWFYDINQIVNDMQSTSTSAFEPVLFDYDSLEISTTTKHSLPPTWEAFSTTTIGQYIPPTVLSIWRLLMQSVLWFAFAAYVYHTLGKQFHTQNV